MTDRLRDGGEATGFYDRLAGDYTRQFTDWRAAQDRQAAVLDTFLRPPTAGRMPRVLDVACGVGTQTLGLARLGYHMTAADVSAESVQQARRYATDAGLDVSFAVADFRDLSALPAGFDAVICCDNALPHLLTDTDMLTALHSMRSRLRPGGLVLVTIRDYDLARHDKPEYQPPRTIVDTTGAETMVLQLWDWYSEDQYRLRHLMLTRDGNDWHGHEYQVPYRAITRAELTNLLIQSGFSTPQWHLAQTSGFYQPLVVAGRDE